MFSSTNALLTTYNMAGFQLSNRMVMAPMTRSRAGSSNVSTDMMATYYKQRASAGLIITEGSQVSPQGIGYPDTPGIHSRSQTEGWKKVTEAVHKHDGKIFVQLWHVGRISHPLYHNGDLPVAPSAVRPEGKSFTPQGLKKFVTPRALETEEIPMIVEDFKTAARNAKEAGFDGVEIHGANGYLIDQFLHDGTNKRTDRYGGSLENRSRFPREVIEAAIDVWGSERVGIRLSPSGRNHGIHDSNPIMIFDYFVNELNNYDLAYLHVMEPTRPVKDLKNYLSSVTSHYRDIYEDTLITNVEYDRDSGRKTIENGLADLVAYGRLFLANPDLPERFAADANLNEPDSSTFYGGGKEGYIDYPAKYDHHEYETPEQE